MSNIEFNINNYVMIKVTEAGKRILKREGLEALHKPDADGWSKWQLHSVMEVFGDDLIGGFNPPFRPTIKLPITDYCYTKFAASLGKSVDALTAFQKTSAVSTYAAGETAAELKACPFCGNIPEPWATQNKKTCYTEYRVICFSPFCSVDGPMRITEEEAINAWNTRATEEGHE